MVWAKLGLYLLGIRSIPYSALSHITTIFFWGVFFKGITSSKSDCAVTDRGQINCQLLIRACDPGHGYNENKVCSVWFYKSFERTHFFLCFTNFVGYCIALDNYKGIINNNKDVLSKLQHVLLCCVLGLSWIGFSMLF